MEVCFVKYQKGEKIVIQGRFDTAENEKKATICYSEKSLFGIRSQE